MLTGWLLITAGIAAIVRPSVVWPISLGLLAFSIAGLKFVVAVCVEGLDLSSSESPNG